jgi:hypothetical protein
MSNFAEKNNWIWMKMKTFKLWELALFWPLLAKFILETVKDR